MNDQAHIINRLCKHGYSTYIVGGAVRDMLDGKEPHDIDIATQATPDEVQELFADYNVKIVGKSFGVVLVDGYEVATFRTDHYNTLLNAQECEVSFANTIQEDLARRDLTVNALALCEMSGNIIDEHNGVQDLKNKVIRFVGDPYERINEDPNRIIRACRFLAKLEGTFAPDTLVALQDTAHYVQDHIAPERIMLEILKAMEVRTPSLFFSALETIGALQYILPELSDAVDHAHGKHHIENVWEHMMLAGDHASPVYPVVRLAAYLHDIGKPMSFDATKIEGGAFHGHECTSYDILNKRLPLLKFSNEHVQTIAGLAQAHMWCGYDSISPKAVRKLHKRLNDMNINVNDWLRIRIADRAANIKKQPFTFTDIRERIELVMQPIVDLPLSTHDLKVTGGGLIKEFKLQPGPVVGRLQKYLLDYVLEYGEQYNEYHYLIKEAYTYLKERNYIE